MICQINEVINISQRGIKFNISYILNFVDGIEDVIAVNPDRIVDDKLYVNLYIPIDFSLTVAQDAINSIEEDCNEKDSEV